MSEDSKNGDKNQGGNVNQKPQGAQESGISQQPSVGTKTMFDRISNNYGFEIKKNSLDSNLAKTEKEKK